MKLLLHRLTNWRGLRNFEIQPGKVSFLFGENGVGKTAVLDSFRSLAEGGADPDSISTWADEAVIHSVWEIQEGDHADYPAGVYKITRTVKRDGFGLDVKGPNGKKIPKEATFVKTFLPVMGFDPLAFDALTDEERAQALKTLLFVPVKAAEIKDAASLVKIDGLDKEVYENGIGAIEFFTKQLKERATGLRAGIKELSAQVLTFKKTFEGKTAEDVQADLEAARQQVVENTVKLTTGESLLMGVRTTAKAEADATSRKSEEVVNKEYEDARAKLDAEYASSLANLVTTKNSKLTEISSALSTAKTVADEEFIAQSDAVLIPIRNAISTAQANVVSLEEKAREADKLAGAKTQVEAWEKATREKQMDLDRIGVACDQLDLLRSNKLAEMQLDGMEIKGGRLYIGGVLSSIVNTAARYMKWWEVAKRYAKHGQPIIIDALAELTLDSRELFEKSVYQYTGQVIGAVSNSGPLEIRDTLAPNEADLADLTARVAKKKEKADV
jgi:hypothetical protein